MFKNTNLNCISLGDITITELLIFFYLETGLRNYYVKVAQIPGARSLGALNFVHCRLIFVGPEYVTLFVLPSGRIEYSGNS
jgi:hypothetical protein